MVTAPVVAASFVAGYAVADATGVRPLGGVVLLGGCGWAARRWARRHGVGAALALAAVDAVAFVGSHRLARRIGAWPSVAVASAVAGAAAALADAG